TACERRLQNAERQRNDHLLAVEAALLTIRGGSRVDLHAASAPTHACHCMLQMYYAVFGINGRANGVHQADVATCNTKLPVAVNCLFRALTIDNRSGTDPCCVRSVKTLDVTKCPNFC